MQHVILIGALVVSGSVGSAVLAQSVTPLIPVATAQSTTVEGCLIAGSAPGEFIISAGGERHTVVAGQGVDLAAHVSHRVQLTGAWRREMSSA
jgi:hypothetical protein